jgi:hypothetical protein
MSRVVISLLLASICVGCIPAQFTTLPGLSGKVVDAGAGRPIAGAHVSMYYESWRTTTSSPVSEATPVAQASASDVGNVDLKPKTRWAILIAGMDFIQERVRVTVRADGFETASLERGFSETPLSPRYIDLGTVRLIRVASSK